MMKTSIKLMLNTQRANKDGTYSLVFQIIRQRKKRLIYTGNRLYREEFDITGEQIIVRRGNKSRNNFLRSLIPGILSRKNLLIDVVEQLDSRLSDYTVDDIIVLFKSQTDMNCPGTFVLSVIERLSNEGRKGTASNYRSLYNVVKKFMNGRPLLFTDMDTLWVRNFESYLIRRHLRRNTISFYLRMIRTLYFKAVKENIIPAGNDPFRLVNMHEEETVKRAVLRSDIRKIAYADLSAYGRMEHWARDLFMFSFYTRGMAFVDIIYLRNSDISGNILRYRRRKTGQLLQMRIERPLAEIIQRYRNKTPFVLPFLGEIDTYERYRYIQRRLNKAIRKVGEILGFSFPLTFYIARHTWATLAYKDGIPVPVISEGMGHTSEKTTRIYLAQLDPDILDKANHRVIRLD